MHILAKRRRRKKKNRGILLWILLIAIVGATSYYGALKLLGNKTTTNSNRKSPDIKDVAQKNPEDNEKKEDENKKQEEEKNVEGVSKEPEEEEKKEEEVKEDQPPEETVKPDSAFAEEVVNNFSVLYPITVNSGRTIDVLGQLIVKDSPFYNEIKKQLDSYKKDKVTIQFTNFALLEINYVGNEEFDISVSQELVETKAGSSNTKKQNVVYRVKSSKDKTGIISAKVN